MNSRKTQSFAIDHKWIATCIFLVSIILRWILILRGGQYYNSDETRYLVSLDAARLIWHGQPGEALRQFTISPEHLGFKVIGVIPALAEQILGPSLVLPALFFSLFSVLNLYLIFLLARHRQSSSQESLYALFLSACCLSLLYYSRHLIPYDAGMLFGLMAVYAALAQKGSVRTALACGLLSFLCFITYNGYWPLAGFAVLANIFSMHEKTDRRMQKVLFAALGFLIPLVLLILTARQVGAAWFHPIVFSRARSRREVFRRAGACHLTISGTRNMRFSLS